MAEADAHDLREALVDSVYFKMHHVSLWCSVSEVVDDLHALTLTITRITSKLSVNPWCGLVKHCRICRVAILKTAQTICSRALYFQYRQTDPTPKNPLLPVSADRPYSKEPFTSSTNELTLMQTPSSCAGEVDLLSID